MKTSCRGALLVAIALAGCGRVGYVGGGLDAGGEPLADADGKRDATDRTDAHDSGTNKVDGRADADNGLDAGTGEAGATDTGALDAVTEAAAGDAGDAGGPDARADAPQACTPMCVAGVSNGAMTSTSYTCTMGKLATTGVACAFGCDSTTGLCADLVPANAAASYVQSGDRFTCLGSQGSLLPSISGGLNGSIVFNTNTDTTANPPSPSVTVNGSLIHIPWGAPYIPPTGSTPAIVAHLGGLSLSAGASVTITGTNALILLVDGNVAIEGSVDLSAHHSSAGPGTRANIAGRGGSTTGASGGGGGGHGVAGGSGGTGNGSSTSGAAGAAYGSAFVLEAGSSGGNGGNGSAGKGGGGLQISACGDLVVGPGALINGSGGGGSGAAAAAGTLLGGSGGGSGGTILLESATLSNLNGSLVANGGGGGQGATVPLSAGAEGSDWSGMYYVPASGGGVPGKLGSGGAGGTGMTATGNGMSAALAAGGGGGGYGAIFIGVSPLMTITPSAPNASPTPVYDSVCTTAGHCAY